MTTMLRLLLVRPSTHLKKLRPGREVYGYIQLHYAGQQDNLLSAREVQPLL